MNTKDILRMFETHKQKTLQAIDNMQSCLYAVLNEDCSESLNKEPEFRTGDRVQLNSNCFDIIPFAVKSNLATVVASEMTERGESVTVRFDRQRTQGLRNSIHHCNDTYTFKANMLRKLEDLEPRFFRVEDAVNKCHDEVHHCKYIDDSNDNVIEFYKDGNFYYVKGVNPVSCHQGEHQYLFTPLHPEIFYMQYEILD